MMHQSTLESELPNVLYLVHRFPYPPDKGDRIRAYHVIRHLHGRCRLHVAALADEPVDPAHRAALEQFCERLDVVPLRRAARWIRVAKSLAGGKTATEGAFRSRRFRAAVRRAAGKTPPQAVLISASSMAPYLRVPELRGVPVIADLVDVDSEKWLQYAANTDGPKRWLYLREGRRLRRLERHLLQTARAVTFVSQAEAELFRHVCGLHLANGQAGANGHGNGSAGGSANGNGAAWLSAEPQPGVTLHGRPHLANGAGATPDLSARIHAVPNGVDLEYFSPDAAHTHPAIVPQPPAGPSLVFLGAMDYPPNVDAVTWFCREVWSSLRPPAKRGGGSRSDAEHALPRFTIVGRRPSPAVRQLAELPGVEVTGAVPDVRPYLAQAAMVVAPLRIARGIQNKVLEALAMGCPVVASAEALSGLDVEPGVHVLEAGTPAEWTAAIRRLLADETLRNELGAAGRRYVEEHHDWDAQLSRLGDLLAAPAAAPFPQPDNGSDVERVAEQTRDTRLTFIGTR